MEGAAVEDLLRDVIKLIGVLKGKVEHVLPLQQNATLGVGSPSRAVLCSTFSEDIDRNVFLKLIHVVLPL